MAKRSKFEQACLEQADLICNDWFIAFDPSSGSKSSQPGYSLWCKGNFCEAGVFNIGAGGPIHYRLRDLDEKIRTDDHIKMAKVAAIEYIPPLIKGKAAIQLHKSIAVLEVASPTEKQLYVPAQCWRKHLPEGYVKQDDHDAVAIGWAVVEAAFRLTERPTPEKPWRYLTGASHDG